MSNNKSNILVSICCITYNHAPFIRKALDGFLMQQAPSCVPQGYKMSDWCEILIHDDCSTDGTTEIIKEYAAKYPDLIFPLYEEENQYSKGVKVDFYNYNRAKGKYIAYCEGDDYWTNPNKLQKQVDFMEMHPEYSVCFHCFKNYLVDKGTYVENTQPTQLIKQHGAIDGMDIDMDTYFQGWFTQPLTMLYRVSMYDFEIRKKYKHYRDMHEIYYLLKAGKCRLMNFEGGVRNVHSGGVASMREPVIVCAESLVIAEELYHFSQDVYTTNYYARILQWAIYMSTRHRFKKWQLSWRLFSLNKNCRMLIKNLIKK